MIMSFWVIFSDRTSMATWELGGPLAQTPDELIQHSQQYMQQQRQRQQQQRQQQQQQRQQQQQQRQQHQQQRQQQQHEQQQQQQQTNIQEELHHPSHSTTTPPWGIEDIIVVSNRRPIEPLYTIKSLSLFHLHPLR